MRARMSLRHEQLSILAPPSSPTSHHECFGDPPLRPVRDVIGGRAEKAFSLIFRMAEEGLMHVEPPPRSRVTRLPHHHSCFIDAAIGDLLQCGRLICRCPGRIHWIMLIHRRHHIENVLQACVGSTDKTNIVDKVPSTSRGSHHHAHGLS